MMLDFLKPEVGELGNKLPYFKVGQGKQVLVVLPGISDALQPLTTMPRFQAWVLRRFSREFTVYGISRRRHLPTAYTTREMAADYALAISEITRQPVHVLGLSMGSLIGQYLAADFPQQIRSLVLALASSHGTPQTIAQVRKWVRFARKGTWKKLYASTVNATFTGFYRSLWHQLLPLMAGLPKIPHDFIVASEACINHDSRKRLSAITAPTLVLGGTRDKLVPARQFEELAQAIPNAKCHLIKRAGHGVYEEKQRSFDRAALDFILKHS